MKQLAIRRALLSDLEELRIIGRQTFHETFADHNTQEDMREYLERNFSVQRLTDELSNKDSEFYLAAIEDKTIGYLKLNCGASQTELKDPRSLEIERIYVLNAFHGEGAGQALCEKALEVARSRHMEYVWLGVWEKNPRAIRFYEKNGFVAFDRHVFRLGKEAQTDIMMKRDLR